MQFLREEYQLPEELCFKDVSELKDSVALRSVQIDVVTAGFPCQAVSVDGKREGLSGMVRSTFFTTRKQFQRIGLHLLRTHQLGTEPEPRKNYD
jgi:site-specific DNA-cytosine methylase